MTEDANRPIKALLTMDEVVVALDEAGRAGVTELAERVDRPRSVVHDYLSTLVQLGYVRKDGTEYRLSLRFLELGGRIRDRIPLYGIARPQVRELAAESSSELVTLIVEDEGLGVCLDVVRSSRSITYDVIPGMYFHLHCSGAGKAMLAHYPRERVEAIVDRHGLPAHTENTITDPEELFAELEAIREDGISFEREEYKRGMITVGAPITDSDGGVLGGISVSGPAHRMREPEVEAVLADQLLSAINIIELNYSAGRSSAP
jgi:DNA-binding IclR family transcriptional regulator